MSEVHELAAQLPAGQERWGLLPQTPLYAAWTHEYVYSSCPLLKDLSMFLLIDCLANIVDLWLSDSLNQSGYSGYLFMSGC